MTEAEQEAEAHRLRRTTRHLVLSLAAVALFAVAFGAIYLKTRQPEPPPPSPAPSVSPSPTPAPVTRETLLLQATTPTGAVGNLLVGVAPDDETAPPASLVPLPADLVVAAPGVSPQPLSRTVDSLDTLRPANTVAATLGVRVDASWRMDRKALAGLVDSVGGVTAEVADPLKLRDETGAVVLRLRAGRQRLSGTDASWFAVGDVRGGTVAAATDRFLSVITPTLRRLPDSDVAIRESLTALGALAPTTIGTQELADFLLELGTAVRSGGAVSETLPTAEVGVAGASAEWLSYAGATPRLRSLLPYAQWQAGIDGPARVLVAAARPTPEVMSGARAAVTGAGFVFVDGRGDRVSGERRTRIQVRGPRALATQVATALGTPGAAVERVPRGALQGAPWADADVVLGTAYRSPGAAPPTLAP